MKWKCSNINYSVSILTVVGKSFQASNAEQWRWLCSIIIKKKKIKRKKRQILRDNCKWNAEGHP